MTLLIILCVAQALTILIIASKLTQINSIIHSLSSSYINLEWAIRYVLKENGLLDKFPDSSPKESEE